MDAVNMKFKCPIDYDIDNCSSKEYRLTCETCFHTQDTKNEERYCTPYESLEQSLKEMKLIREGKLPKKSWNDLKTEIKKEGIIKIAKIKQIGGNPKEISHDAKDVLIWLNCSENKSHSSYLITPYAFSQIGLRCPLCEGRKPITPYQIRFGVKMNNDDNQAGVFGKPEYFTTIQEAKDEVNRTFITTIKEMFPDAECGELVMISDLKCDCGCNMESAKYEDSEVELFGRMDGTFDGGEFYVEIVKAQQS